jgi:hypothetical protein
MRADQRIAIASAVTGLGPGIAGRWDSPRRRGTLSAVMAVSRAASGCSRPTWAYFDSYDPNQIRSLKRGPVHATDPMQRLTLVCDQGNGSNPEKILVSFRDRRDARKLTQDFNRDVDIVVQSAQCGRSNMRSLHSDSL